MTSHLGVSRTTLLDGLEMCQKLFVAIYNLEAHDSERQLLRNLQEAVNGMAYCPLSISF